MTINLFIFFVHSDIHYFHCIFVVLTYACNVKLMRLTWLNKGLLTYLLKTLQLLLQHLTQQPPKPTQHNRTLVIRLANANISFQMQPPHNRSPPGQQQTPDR